MDFKDSQPVRIHAIAIGANSSARAAARDPIRVANAFHGRTVEVAPPPSQSMADGLPPRASHAARLQDQRSLLEQARRDLEATRAQWEFDRLQSLGCHAAENRRSCIKRTVMPLVCCGSMMGGFFLPPIYSPAVVAGSGVGFVATTAMGALCPTRPPGPTDPQAPADLEASQRRVATLSSGVERLETEQLLQREGRMPEALASLICDYASEPEPADS